MLKSMITNHLNICENFTYQAVEFEKERSYLNILTLEYPENSAAVDLFAIAVFISPQVPICTPSRETGS